MVSVRANDHWAFLEEIEAPMWVDLTQEANLYIHSIADEWFRSSHIFHWCSAHELKSAFSHSSEKLKASERESVGASSPKLPSSVSKSRGKDFKRKNWGGQVENLILNNQHPMDILRGSSPILNSNLARRLKPKPSYINPTSISSSKYSFSESSNAMNVMPSRLKTSSVSENSKGRFTSSTQNRERRTDSTVTTESKIKSQQQVVEVSSKVNGQSNRLISIMRKSLQNFRVTSQASRVEMKKIERSGSSESLLIRKTSSVGSCSNTVCDVKSSMPKCLKNRDLEIRNVGRMTCSSKNKMKSVNTKAPAILVEAEKSSSRPTSRSFQAKTGKQEVVKPKTGHAKALAPQRVTQTNSLQATHGAKGKGSYVGKNKIVVVGKENVNGRMPSNHKVNDKETRVGGKVTRQNIKGKANDRIDGKPKNGIGRVYLR